jgi:tetratricopeptide (TPR) repeat protein
VGHRRKGSAQPFFDAFRAAVARAPAGLHRPGPPATPAAIATAEAALGRPLPDSYADFLRSFDGAELFHETVILYGVGGGGTCALVEANAPPRPPTLAEGELVVAESAGGDRYALDAEGRVVHLRAGSDERWLAGSSFPRWLDALLTREALLYDAEGEFLLEAFEPDGEELTPAFALRQAERALRKDPDAAEAHHDLGIALRRIGRPDRAREAFARAAALDPGNPWPWFDLGRAALDEAVADANAAAPGEAIEPFRRAAEAIPGPEGARMLVWAARAADQAGQGAEADRARADAQARDPDLATALRRAVDASADDPEAHAEAERLLEALAPRRRLPVLGDDRRRR